ncbi:MAG TPA: endonuclease Q family protein, partial [Candidatus Paceibacterota bacterium]|nr:endonuclease Q family protein [Candidatus Paceibacterota bacterium]
WFRELKAQLEPAEPGLYKFKNGTSETRFLLTAEISSIYSQGGKCRRIHNLVFAPSLEIAEKINVALSWQGNLESDGRPILGISSIELARLVFGISSEAVIIPAHAWTPWFSIFGSMSGFDSIEECFGEFAPRIFAFETGLSSDPAMNWRLSQLDRISFISNSDSHSAEKIGREANVFDTELSYNGIISAIKEKDPKKFLYTIEFFPEEGKYHYDGHRLCGVVFSPEESKKCKNICPKCGKPLTIGVMNRVDALADRPVGYQPEGRVPFKKLVPLNEIIAESLGVSVISKKVKAEYERLIGIFGTELHILLDVDLSEIKAQASAELADGLRRMREGNIYIRPGYDGEYGKVKIFNEEEPKVNREATLF